jgi:hypothetical protein
MCTWFEPPPNWSPKILGANVAGDEEPPAGSWEKLSVGAVLAVSGVVDGVVPGSVVGGSVLGGVVLGGVAVGYGQLGWPGCA